MSEPAPVYIGQASAVSMSLYLDLAQQIADVHNMLNEFGVPDINGSLRARVSAVLRLAEMRGASWILDGEERDYRETIASFEAGTGRV